MHDDFEQLVDGLRHVLLGQPRPLGDFIDRCPGQRAVLNIVRPMIEGESALGVMGNHEFDDGPEVLRGFMDAVDFPVLMSNADVSREEILAGKLAKSAVFLAWTQT